MKPSALETATPDKLAPILLAALQRLGRLGREGALALARLIPDGDDDVEEAAEWIADIAHSRLIE